MSDISELESRLSAALERIGRGVDAMQAVVAEPDTGEDIQALRRALENEALVTAQMEERVRALTASKSDLEAELAAEKDARSAAEETIKAAESAKEEAAQALLAAEARAEAAETAAAAAADAAATQASSENESAASGGNTETDANRALLDELAKRLRRLRQMARRERTTNQVLRDQVEKGEMVDPSAVNDALKADLATLTALREAEMTETALILAELRPLVQGVTAQDAPQAASDEVAPAMADETGEA
ncbi:hypothetical protein J7413_02360 [Shimia sp. R10_1]|uniref:hypothetical protein n=1 Tax=Shimia sp. R10_1 TaxID=2821095 RepID=UPI001ADA56E1|nr:hypothetical protein [Shimia sp. R10_1]MBO9472370.1 hypothetical protein [Shimia sp. R10_1]